jgi:hypothetical protein
MKPEKKPTNVSFVDRLLCGGTKPKGVYGILSPTGVGKSTLAAMIAANGATGPSIFSHEHYQSLPWILFDLHNGPATTKNRVLSHVAEIKRDRVYRTTEAMIKYEPRGKNGKMIPESIRFKRACEKLNLQLLAIWDFEPNLANIENTLFSYAQVRGGWGGIVIDGARQVWYASQPTTNLPETKFLEHLVSDFCRRIANRYACPVWITHQIRGAKCDAPPTMRLSHRDASDCKAFADTMDACLVIGNESDPNPDSVFSIACTKGEPDQVKKKPMLLMHDPYFASIVEAEGYVEDRSKRTYRKAPDEGSLLRREDMEHIEQLLKVQKKGKKRSIRDHRG